MVNYGLASDLIPGRTWLVNPKNLFDNRPKAGPEEALSDLLKADGLRIERIVSHGHSSPPGFWYEQDENEWVILLSGAAAITFEGSPTPVEIKPGDYLNIPAYVRHRVEWTAPDQDSVWLAVFYS
ncbi:hypothetical protein C7271_15660 [filamentous cyanobacterium CCP5]|nr:hypothetical protein C7271_15660 [filamentous cyanobacterium CCP5]